MYTNNEVLEKILEKTGVENDNQLSKYLSEKYSIKITRQQINQFKRAERTNLTHLLLREALEP